MGKQRRLGAFLKGSLGISGPCALKVTVGSESGNRNREHGKHHSRTRFGKTVEFERDRTLKGCYLAEGELPCELGPQHDHAAYPEQEEVTASFQKRQRVETSEI